MAFRLIHIQNFSRLCRKGRIHLKETFRYVFMNRTLADSELLRRLPDCSLVFYNIICNLYSPFFYILFQKIPPGSFVVTRYANIPRLIQLFFQNFKSVLENIYISHGKHFFISPSLYYILKVTMKINCTQGATLC